jgi:hypothetical protein
MSASTLSISTRDAAGAGRILAAGAAVALLDGIAAVTLCFAVSATCTVPRVFQGIAAGLLGRPSFDGGTATAIAGAGLHLTIATGWATAYSVLARRLPSLQRLVRTTLGVVGVGMAYGAVVWLLMNRVVVPLSRARATPLFTGVWWVLLVIHLLVVGLPIALIIRDGSRR